jgi:Protein of unknown function (DUF2490)
LLSDRNRVEFRWVEGEYSTRYRNKLNIQHTFNMNPLRLVPYLAAEAFYDGGKNSWNEQQYTAGMEWQYKRLLMLQTYYLRQNCSPCSTEHLNVFGLTLNLYLRTCKRKYPLRNSNCETTDEH